MVEVRPSMVGGRRKNSQEMTKHANKRRKSSHGTSRYGLKNGEKWLAVPYVAFNKDPTSCPKTMERNYAKIGTCLAVNGDESSREDKLSTHVYGSKVRAPCMQS